MATTASVLRQSWFARASVQGIVLGAFFLLTVPILAASLTWPEAAEPLLPLYGVTFGLTHFLVTGLVYLDARNLRYFAASWSNRIVYFAVPCAILLGMDLLAVVDLGEAGVAIHSFLFYFIMCANYLHVSRQSFGVLQLFKRESRAQHAESLRSLENLFFIALVAGQFWTFVLGGEYDGSALGVQLTSLMTAALFVLVLGMHVAALRGVAGQRALARTDWTPLLYFTLQAISGALVVYRSGFVTIALAMHYVEYQVVMLPRVFHAPVDRASRADRTRAVLGRVPMLFYAGLLAVAWGVWFGQRTALYLDPEALSLPMRLAVHALDGIFLFHFFVEAFLWKFSKPHYRETLGPLYFAPASAQPAASQPS